MSDTVVAGLVGLVSGAIGGFLTQMLSVRATIKAELRTATRELAVALSAALHSMCWILWFAKARGSVTEQEVSAYNKEIHQVSPKMLGQLTVIASLDSPTYERLRPVIQEVFSLDAKIGELFVLGETMQVSVDEIKKLHEQVSEKEYSIPDHVAKVLSERIGSSL